MLIILDATLLVGESGSEKQKIRSEGEIGGKSSRRKCSEKDL